MPGGPNGVEGRLQDAHMAGDREEEASSASDGELDVEQKASRLYELMTSGHGSSSGTKSAASGAVSDARKKTKAGATVELDREGRHGADDGELPDDVMDSFLFRNAPAHAPAALRATQMRDEVQAPVAERAGGAAAAVGPAVLQQRGAEGGPSQGTATRAVQQTGPLDAAVPSRTPASGGSPVLRPRATTGESLPL